MKSAWRLGALFLLFLSLASCEMLFGIKQHKLHKIGDFVSSYSSAVCVDGGDLYFGGVIEAIAYSVDDHDLQEIEYDQESTYYPGYWTNLEWQTLPSPNSKNLPKITGIACSQDDIYILGYFNSYSTNRFYNEQEEHPGYWKNGLWHDLPIPDGFLNASVETIHIIDGEVLICGNCSGSPAEFEPSHKSAVVWVDDDWELLRPASEAYSSIAAAAVLVNGKYLVCGSCEPNINYPQAHFAEYIPGYWENGTWIRMDANTGGMLQSLTASDDALYAGGFFYNENWADQYRRGYWEGGSFTSLKKEEAAGDLGFIGVSLPDVYALCYSRPGNVGCPAGFWKNAQWYDVTYHGLSSSPLITLETFCALLYDNALFIAGSVKSVEEYNSDERPVDLRMACYWRDAAWCELPLPEFCEYLTGAFK